MCALCESINIILSITLMVNRWQFIASFGPLWEYFFYETMENDVPSE